MITNAVPPLFLQHHGHIRRAFVERAEPEPTRHGEPAGVDIGDHDLGGAVLGGEQRGQQSHHAGAGDQDRSSPDAGAKIDRPTGQCAVRGRVQQAVGADQTHMRDVNA